MSLLCPVVAGLITGGVSAYNRCAAANLLVILVGLAVFAVVFYWRGEPGPAHAIAFTYGILIVGIGLVAGWAIGAVVGYSAQRS